MCNRKYGIAYDNILFLSKCETNCWYCSEKILFYSYKYAAEFKRLCWFSSYNNISVKEYK